jgi:hypothetical protein
MSWYETRLSMTRHMHEDVSDEGETVYVDPING